MKNPQVGQYVLVYDHAKFPHGPAKGRIIAVDLSADIVILRLVETYGTTAPGGYPLWVSRRQLRKDKATK